MIATILTTLCREAKSPLQLARFSRHGVASDAVPNQAIPAASGHFVRMARNLMNPGGKHPITAGHRRRFAQVFCEPRQLSRQIGEISKNYIA